MVDGPTGETEPELDPRTVVLDLPTPIYHLGDYLEDARSRHAVGIVDLLSNLHAENVDRSETPHIAGYKGPKVDMSVHYERAIAEAVVDEAIKVGLRVEVEASDGSVWRERPTEEPMPEPSGWQQAWIRVLKLLGRHTPHPEPEPPKPDFYLKIDHHDDSDSFKPHPSQPTSGIGGFTRYRHSVRIQPITYQT